MSIWKNYHSPYQETRFDHWAKHLNISSLKIFSDSRVVIDWLIGKSNLRATYLKHWCSRIRHIEKQFSSLSYNHIFREQNTDVDSLSKRGLGCQMGILWFSKVKDLECRRIDRYQLCWLVLWFAFLRLFDWLNMDTIDCLGLIFML